MIIIDFSQVVISNIQQNLKNAIKKADAETKSLIKHMILTTLLSYKKKFGKEYGQLVIALDGRDYWRKDIFSYYKGHRKRDREKSDLNWEFIYECMNEVKKDLRENFPYKIIEVHKAEGDDIIACIVKYIQDHDLIQVGIVSDEPQPVMIVSSDTDFCQLQKYANVKQWSPMQKKFVKPSVSIDEFIIEHICTGDAGDGIPNICSADNCIFDKIRQSSFKKARLIDFINKKTDACISEEEKRNYQRNERLIDFEFIPKEMYDAIINEYVSQTPTGSKQRIFNYLVKNRMRQLLENAGDF